MDRVRSALLRAAGALALAAGASLAFAQPVSNSNGPTPTAGVGPNEQGGPGGGQQQHRNPPPEALEACKTFKAGQSCSFTSPRGAEQGTCFAPEGKSLACRPNNAPGNAGGPPNGGQGQSPRQ